MYALIGEDRPLFNTKQEPESQIEPTRTKTVDDLFSQLWEIENESYCENDGKEAEKELEQNKYGMALGFIFKERKEEISMPFIIFEDAKLDEQSKALQQSTSDCLKTINGIDKDYGNPIVQIIDEHMSKAYKDLPNQLVEVRQEIFEKWLLLTDTLKRQQKVRPISLGDFQAAEKILQLKEVYWCNQIRNDFCNFALLSSTFFMKKQKRRNFPKKATKILNEYFEAHINQPYPDEATKQYLADICCVTVSQVSNWFGNKRIRFKKALERKSNLTNGTNSNDNIDDQ